ncbi:MAG TPA: GYD domain-containing protein [Steroidobacteraceae bacterium]|nr:GYD domain-containing protein [Steroidobacteraceae bacterium]
MAMYMLMAKYSAAAIKGIVEKGGDREAIARQTVEAAGGKLHGFYGMFGQEYGLAMIIEAPGHAEYIGGIIPAITAGTFDSFKTIPLYTAADLQKAIPISKKVAKVYKPPMS